MFKTDLEIAQECVMEPITEIAKKAGISEEDLEVYGKYKAKVSLDVLKKRAEEPDGKLILVTAINPTKGNQRQRSVWQMASEDWEKKQWLLCVNRPWDRFSA